MIQRVQVGREYGETVVARHEGLPQSPPILASCKSCAQQLVLMVQLKPRGTGTWRSSSSFRLDCGAVGVAVTGGAPLIGLRREGRGCGGLLSSTGLEGG